MTFGSVTPVFNEEDLIGPFLDLMDVSMKVVVISDQTFKGNRLEHDQSEDIAVAHGAYVIRVDTADQIEMRNLGLAFLAGNGIEMAFLADCDEWYPTETLANYKRFMEENPADSYRAKMQVMFRRPNWGVTSPNDPGSCIAVGTDKRMTTIRTFNGEKKDIPIDLGTIYHLSYARSPAKIKEKIENFSHAHEVIPTWYEQVYLPCTEGSQNVHPTVPEAWPTIATLQLPLEILGKIPQKLWTN